MAEIPRLAVTAAPDAFSAGSDAARWHGELTSAQEAGRLVFGWTVPYEDGNSPFAGGRPEYAIRNHLGFNRDDINDIAEGRIETITHADTLLVINSLEGMVFARDNHTWVGNAIGPESRDAMYLALGARKRVVLSHGFPEGHPDVLMQPPALRAVGVTSLKAGTLTEKLEELLAGEGA